MRVAVTGGERADGHGPPPHRISVSGACSLRHSVAEDLELWARHRVRCVSIPAAKLGPGDAGRVADAGLRVTSVLVLGPELDSTASWSRYRDRLRQLFDDARTMAAELVVLTTGPAGRLPWDEAAGALGDVLGPLAGEAPAPLAVEHTNQLRSDISFVHRLADAVDLARALGIGVVVETTACWQERDVLPTIDASADVIGLVHLSDLPPVVHSTPDRMVPGDGVLPLQTMVRALMASGYGGAFELEYAGPRIEAMGYDAALGRALPALAAILAAAAADRSTPSVDRTPSTPAPVAPGGGADERPT